MGRMRLLISSPRLIALTALAVLSLALGATLLSGASFTSHSQNPARLTAGSLQLSSSKPGQSIVGASGMVPGDSRVGSISIVNEGDVAGNVTLGLDELVESGSAKLSAVLELTVQDVTGTPVQLWSGKLGTLGSVEVGSFAPSQNREFRFTLAWPPGSTDPGLQGATTSFAFEWVGVS